jgi:hypothetical protein
MIGETRKAAVAAYKERKVVAGIYAVRCLTDGKHWIGHAPDLSTIQNRLWFMLRHGNSAHLGLQAAWRDHGAENFTFTEIERLDDESLGFARDRVVKDRLGYWRTALGAEAI